MNSFNRMAFGEKLKALRTDKGLGQNALAKALDVSNASISYWETGKQEPTAQAIYKICIFFNVSADYLLGITFEWQ